MKKILCAIAVVTTVSLMGCGTVQKENPAGTTQEQKVSETTAQEITEMKMRKQNHKAELKKAGLTLEGYEYCGNGKLDMVEWIYTDIQS